MSCAAAPSAGYRDASPVRTVWLSGCLVVAFAEVVFSLRVSQTDTALASLQQKLQAEKAQQAAIVTELQSLTRTVASMSPPNSASASQFSPNTSPKFDWNIGAAQRPSNVAPA